MTSPRSRTAVPVVVVGVLLVVIGAVWTAQGLGYLPGSVMSGVTFWAVAGPIIAVIGLLLLVWGWRGRRRSGRDG